MSTKEPLFGQQQKNKKENKFREKKVYFNHNLPNFILLQKSFAPSRKIYGQKFFNLSCKVLFFSPKFFHYFFCPSDRVSSFFIHPVQSRRQQRRDNSMEGDISIQHEGSISSTFLPCFFAKKSLTLILANVNWQMVQRFVKFLIINLAEQFRAKFLFAVISQNSLV